MAAQPIVEKLIKGPMAMGQNAGWCDWTVERRTAKCSHQQMQHEISRLE